MKFIPLILTLSILITGCVSSDNKPTQVPNASRSGGVLQVGFVHNAEITDVIDGGINANWDIGFTKAKATCIKRGYNNAEWLNTLIHERHMYN